MTLSGPRYGGQILAEPEGVALWLGTAISIAAFALGTLLVVWIIARWRKPAAAAVALGATLLSSCGSSGKPAGNKTPAKSYPLHGKVTKLDPKLHIAVIDGDKIEGWMEAMTMEYPVPDPAEFAKLKTGEEVHATVFVRDLDYWVANIQPQAR